MRKCPADDRVYKRRPYPQNGMMNGVLSPEEIEHYNEQGYVIHRTLFSPEEIGLLGEAARNDHAMDEAAAARD